MRQNLSSGFPTKPDSNQSSRLQRLARNLKKSLEASSDMILSNKRIAKVLIKLRGCAGCSASLCVRKEDERFTEDEMFFLASGPISCPSFPYYTSVCS